MTKQQQDELKQEAAKQAAAMVQPGSVLGVGTGSTVKFFIDALAAREQSEGLHLKAIVTTSSRSQKQLEGYGFTVSELADIGQADLIVDGADRVDANLDGIKGGGGALTLEKNVAVNCKKNVWIVDESKVVTHLSGFPLPVEVLPISASTCSPSLRRPGSSRRTAPKPMAASTSRIMAITSSTSACRRYRFRRGWPITSTIPSRRRARVIPELVR